MKAFLGTLWGKIVIALVAVAVVGGGVAVTVSLVDNGDVSTTMSTTTTTTTTTTTGSGGTTDDKIEVGDFVFDVGESLPENSEIVVAPIDNTSDEGKAALDAVEEFDYNKENEVVIYDIHALSNNVKVQPTGEISITLDAPIAGVSSYVIYHIKDNGSIETLYADAENGKISFNISSFSKFVFAEKHRKPDHDGGNNHECAHIEVIDQAVSATCTSTGLTEGKHCSKCGEILVKQEETAKLEHIWNDATCTAPKTCEACGTTEGNVGTHKYDDYYDEACNVCGQTRTVTVSEGLTYELLSDDTYSVVGIGTCTDTDIVIPKVYDGKAVTSIGTDAFGKCTDLTSIVIPESVISIGDSPFFGCPNLTSINVIESNPYYKSIDGNLYSKDGMVFIQYSNGKSDNSFTVPDGVETIAIGAFAYATGLANITISNTVTNICNLAFGYCTVISVTIGENISNISDSAFESCSIVEVYNKSNLDFKNILPNVLNIYTPNEGKSKLYTDENEYIFYVDDTTDLGIYLLGYLGAEKELFLPQTCKGKDYEILGITFRHDITHISIPNTLTSISATAFRNCVDLTSVTIPDSVKSIGAWAFSGCTGLTSITIPDSVISIEGLAFYGCSSLTSVTIGDSVTSIGVQAFYGCSSLTSVTIGDSVTSIGVQAFYNCTSLTSITIPDSVTSIGNAVFSDCTSLTSINFEGTVAEWNAISKEPHWNYNTGNYTVYCTDGNIEK